MVTIENLTEDAMAANPRRQLPDAYLACRDLRHAKEELGYFRERGSGDARWPIIRKLRCLRCGTLRRDTLSNSDTEKGP